MSKLRRSMLFVPGANAAMLSNSFIYSPDALMFDLEDSVAITKKDTARLLVFHALQMPLYKNVEKVVRVNPIDSPYGKLDVEAMVRAGVDVIRLPKTDSAEDILEMERHILQVERKCGRAEGSTRMMAAIESAQGVINAPEIAKSSPRLIGIALGAEDYVRDIRTERSPDGIELMFARCSILQAARAAGIAAFDTVYSNANNEEGFIHEAEHIKQLGFDGKSLINPRQIELLHNVFAPTRKEIGNPRLIIEAAENASRQGLGVVSLNGKMIDAPIIERARWVLQRAEASGIRQ